MPGVELGRAVAATWAPYWLYYAERLPQTEILCFDGATAVSFGLPHPLFNQVVETDPGITAQRAGGICEAMGGRGLPWMWTGIPDNEEDFLQPLLSGLGMAPAFNMPGMALDLGTAAFPASGPEGLTLHEATDVEGLGDYAAAVLPAFEMPVEWGSVFSLAHGKHGFYPEAPARFFYGVAQGKPVCGSMVFYTGGVAAIQCVGTLPEARGKGYASAAVWACLRAAREEGCRYAVLQASAMGQPVYERIGFRSCFRQHFYMPVPPPEGPAP